AAIGLHNQPHTEVHEIHHIAAQRLLTAKFLTPQPVAAHESPKQLFRIGHVAVQLSGDESLVHFHSPDDSLMLSLQQINSRKSCPKGTKANPYRRAMEVAHRLKAFRTAPLTPSPTNTSWQIPSVPPPPRSPSMPTLCSDGRSPVFRAARRCGG